MVIQHKVILGFGAWALWLPNASFGQSFEDTGYWGHMWGGEYGASFMGHGLGVLFWVLIAALLIYLFTKGSSKGDTLKDLDAEQILQRRFARGEISADELESSRKTLNG